jgi:hypothetical protein
MNTTCSANTMTAINTIITKAESQQVYLSGLPGAQSVSTGQMTTTYADCTNTIPVTTSGSAFQVTIPNGEFWVGDASQYVYPHVSGNNTVPNTPNIFTWPPNGFQYNPIPGPPNLDSLEEGVHDIKGGKIIIKKIMVSEEELEEAIQEACGPESTPEERDIIRKEIEEIAASEEREI